MLLLATLWMLVTVELPAGAPRWSEPDTWSSWAADSATVDVVVALARPLGMAVTAYLLLVTLVQLLPGRRRGPVRRWLQRCTPSLVVTITAGLVAAGPAAGAAEPSVEPAGSAAGRGATMELIEPSPQPSAEPNTHLPWADQVASTSSTVPPTSTTTPQPTTSATSTTSLPPSTTPPATTTTQPAPAPSSPPMGEPEPATPPTPPAAASGADPGIHVVQRGDHLWSIAEHTLQAASAGGTVDDAAVTRYWRVLMEQNRDRLVDPDDPDLILPGQQLVLPPIA
jgi:nucleoid-associated protein YgaU